LAFYGGEDFTPGEFYKIADGETAMNLAREAIASAQLFLS